jgi:hypothetical protein
MSIFQPAPPPYDPSDWAKRPWGERLRISCQAWAIQGYGAPPAIYGLYVLKIFLYIGGWCFFCGFTPGLGDPTTITSWCFEPVAFQKAVLWSMAFEGLGLGCASGPLTGRYSPPIGGVLYFLRPKTIKLPLFPGVPIIGRSSRSWLDVSLYGLHYVFLFWALTLDHLSFESLLPIVILLPVLAVLDKTLFLVARGEHYYITTVCFLFGDDWIAGAMAVQAAIWLWAAVSKLNHHFPSVVSVMTSNSPCTPWPTLRRRMYRRFPTDLRPSRLAYCIAHLGTVTEFSFPLLLIFGDGATMTMVGLVLMVGMHAYITSNFPMAVPIEWNVHVVYGGLFLFWSNAEVNIFDIASPVLLVILILALVIVPLLGNLYPSRVSFLLSMRYYAGNWAWGVWLFRKEGETHRRLEEELPMHSKWVPDQLAPFYDEQTITTLMGKVPAFRAMHLQGRALQSLLPQAVDAVDAYEYVDGEIVAGMVLGWNFGDGHLHHEQLLAAVQERCAFEAGDLRCIFVESQPLGKDSVAWRIVDANSGLLEAGSLPIATLRSRQPWPTLNVK